MMDDRVSVALVGIGGYGEVYLSALLDEPRGARCRIVGAVDPHPGNCRRLAELTAAAIPVYSTMESFYRDHRADLVVISSPIHLHAEHVAQALDRGSNVLVEKPAAATTSDVDAMIETRERTGGFVAVGFQWSFASSVLDLKRDILSGRFGAPRWGRTLTLWPRTESYYARNDWAGRARDSKGRWILDSPASNAMAHHVHNLLFLLGPAMDRSAEVGTVAPRLGRANEIETFDTVAARIETESGVDLLFLASHSIAENEAVDPRFTLELEEATVTFAGGLAPMVARRRDGRIIEYASPDASSQVEKLWTCVEALGGASIPCGLETARPHAAFVEAIEASGVAPLDFPGAMVRRSRTSGGLLRWVDGLAGSMEAAYASGEWPALLLDPH
jgi:predicted dehydrogenase